MTTAPQLRAVPAEGRGDPPNVMELLAQADGLDQLVALVASRVLEDSTMRTLFWERSLRDRNMLLALAQQVRADPKLGLPVLALFGGGVLSNNLMWEAWDQHCWLMQPEPKRIVHGPEVPGPYNNESVDIHLQPEIYFRPKGVTVDLYDDRNILDRIRTWPRRRLNEDPEHPDNLILPGQSFVGTAEWLKLPTDCVVPLTATVFTKSTQARLANFALTPSCPCIKNGHEGAIYIEPMNGSEEPMKLKPGMAIGALYLWPVAGRPIPYQSQYKGQT